MRQILVCLLIVLAACVGVGGVYAADGLIVHSRIGAPLEADLALADFDTSGNFADCFRIDAGAAVPSSVAELKRGRIRLEWRNGVPWLAIISDQVIHDSVVQVGVRAGCGREQVRRYLGTVPSVTGLNASDEKASVQAIVSASFLQNRQAKVRGSQPIVPPAIRRVAQTERSLRLAEQLILPDLQASESLRNALRSEFRLRMALPAEQAAVALTSVDPGSAAAVQPPALSVPVPSSESIPTAMPPAEPKPQPALPLVRDPVTATPPVLQPPPALPAPEKTLAQRVTPSDFTLFMGGLVCVILLAGLIGRARKGGRGEMQMGAETIIAPPLAADRAGEAPVMLDHAGGKAASEVADLATVMDLAEIMVSFGRIPGAIYALEDYVGRHPDESEKPWLKLLELCQQAGEREAFEAHAGRMRVRFGAEPPAWDEVEVPPAKP